MKLPSTQGIGNQSDDEGLKRQLQIFASNIESILNSGITFKDNIRCQIIEVLFDVSNTDKQINHQLNYVPTGYYVVRKSAVIDIYDGASNVFQKTYVTLRSSATGTVSVLIF